MPVYTPPFTTEQYNAFKTRSEAAEAVKKADPHIHERLRHLLTKYGLAHIFGIALVYKHFDLEPGQCMLFKDFLMAKPFDPTVIRDIELFGEAEYSGGRVRPIAWAITSTNKLMPYQFVFCRKDDTKAIDPTYRNWQDFMHDFMHEVEWAELRDYIGLKVFAATDRHDLVSRYDEILDEPPYVPAERPPRSRTPSPGPRVPRRRTPTPTPGPRERTSVDTSTPSPTMIAWREAVERGNVTAEETGWPLANWLPRKRIDTTPVSVKEERLGTPTEEAAEERREVLADADADADADE